MKSSWDSTKSRSSYHFDPKIKDLPSEAMTYLGNVDATAWADDLDNIVQASRPATWETRGYKGQGIGQPREDLESEEYDLSRVGADPKMVITNLNWQLPVSLQTLCDQFGLDDCMSRIHVQMPGQCWNLHLDKLGKWSPNNPERVMRIMIQLSDWAPGQFWEFGNYHWNQWRAGDVVTFDWQNMPHSTANAGHHPRVTFQLTGIKTSKTYDFLANLAQ